MIYLRLLRRVHRVLAWLMARCDPDGKLWAELAWRDGHIAIRQLRYAERVQELTGFRLVKGVTRRPTNWTVSQPTYTIPGTSVNITYRHTS